MTPARIQRTRKKGWRMPEGAVFIGRGTVYGNPYKIGDGVTREAAIFLFRKHLEKMAVDFPDLLQQRLDELRGKVLACWCRECDACHGDVWLEFINNEIEGQS